MTVTNARLLELLEQCDLDTWAVAETLCDAEVARGDYDGCSTDLEMAFADYQERATRVLEEATS